MSNYQECLNELNYDERTWDSCLPFLASYPGMIVTFSLLVLTLVLVLCLVFYISKSGVKTENESTQQMRYLADQMSNRIDQIGSRIENQNARIDRLADRGQ